MKIYIKLIKYLLDFKIFWGFFQYLWTVIDLSNVSMNLDGQNKHIAEDLIQKISNIPSL